MEVNLVKNEGMQAWDCIHSPATPSAQRFITCIVCSATSCLNITHGGTGTHVCQACWGSGKGGHPRACPHVPRSGSGTGLPALCVREAGVLESADTPPPPGKCPVYQMADPTTPGPTGANRTAIALRKLTNGNNL